MATQSWELVWSILSKIDMDSQEREDIYEALLDESVANAHRGLEHGPRRIGHGSPRRQGLRHAIANRRYRL